MTPIRQRETTQLEITALKALITATPDDAFAKPMLEEQLSELESSLDAIEFRPPLNPETEIFFEDGPAIGSEGLEITFTSHILDSYQNMLTNHYAAKHYGVLRRSGRRRGEADTKLYLTALPRGSFGLQLARPHIEDFVAAQHLSSVMHDISALLHASAKSDEAFEQSLSTFNPRVLKPLQRFIETLFSSKAACRVVTGFNETKLSQTQIADAYVRVTAATEREETIQITGRSLSQRQRCTNTSSFAFIACSHRPATCPFVTIQSSKSPPRSFPTSAPCRDAAQQYTRPRF